MIDISYILNEKDFLELNLYHFKTEGKLRALIYKTWMAYSIIIVIIIGLLIWGREYSLALMLLIVAAIISIFHSRTMKNIYLRQFQKSMKAYETRFNKEVKLQVSETQLHIQSIAGNSNFNLSQIDSISETQDHFFIKLKIEAIPIPKLNLEKTADLRHDFINLTNKLDIRYFSDMDWKW